VKQFVTLSDLEQEGFDSIKDFDENVSFLCQEMLCNAEFTVKNMEFQYKASSQPPCHECATRP
jgi:hypothetical protein